jgi:hypothetical protein
MAEVTITVVHTADLTADAARQARRVLDLAFEDDDPMQDSDWEHGLDLDGPLTCDYRKADLW